MSTMIINSPCSESEGDSQSDLDHDSHTNFTRTIDISPCNFTFGFI